MGLKSTHHTTRVTNSILLFFGNFKHPVESHDLTRLRVDPTHKDGLYLLQQKKWHTIENDQELINIFEHKIYSFYINL